MARILVTRAAHQASVLAEALRIRGHEPIVIPTIEIAPPKSFCALDAALACLPSHHWIVFTSANAVQAFAARCRLLGISAFPKQTAAIGAATATALRAAGIEPNLIPPHAVAESLAEALLPFAQQPDGMPSRMLWITAEQPREALAAALQAAGVELTTVAVYRNIIPTSSLTHLAELFQSSIPCAAVTFTSASSVTNLLALLQASGRSLPADIARISIGPITSQAMVQAGLPPHAESPIATIDALAETTTIYLRNARAQ